MSTTTVLNFLSPCSHVRTLETDWFGIADYIIQWIVFGTI